MLAHQFNLLAFDFEDSGALQSVVKAMPYV